MCLSRRTPVASLSDSSLFRPFAAERFRRRKQQPFGRHRLPGAIREKRDCICCSCHLNVGRGDTHTHTHTRVWVDIIGVIKYSGGTDFRGGTPLLAAPEWLYFHLKRLLFLLLFLLFLLLRHEATFIELCSAKPYSIYGNNFAGNRTESRVYSGKITCIAFLRLGKFLRLSQTCHVDFRISCSLFSLPLFVQMLRVIEHAMEERKRRTNCIIFRAVSTPGTELNIVTVIRRYCNTLAMKFP